MDEVAHISHADTAFAVQLRPRALRHILDGGQVRLAGDNGRQPGQWRRLAPVDTMRLGVMSALFRYGCDTDEAAEISATVLTQILGSLEDARGLSLAALTSRLAGMFLRVSFGRGRLAMGRMDLAVTCGPPPASHEHGITINLGIVTNETVQRLELAALSRGRSGLVVT